MAAEIRRLRTRPARLRQDENAELAALLDPLMADEGRRPEFLAAVRKVRALIDRETASTSQRTFCMLYPDQNLAVMRAIAESSRPKQAFVLWALCLNNMVWGTGEIVLSRGELAEELGVAPRTVSSIMTELVEMNAIIRRFERGPGQRGRGSVRYFVNPQVATHEKGKARDDVQDEAGPVLKLVEGTAHPAQRRDVPGERRSRAAVRCVVPF